MNIQFGEKNFGRRTKTTTSLDEISEFSQHRGVCVFVCLLIINGRQLMRGGGGGEDGLTHVIQ